jgi:hypothetical protein
LPSLHGPVVFVCTQPVTVWHESAVHWLPSLQFGAGPPTHAPPVQVSFVVQALPSLQLDVLFANTHPTLGLHESFVQTLPSLQTGAGPPLHVPPLHTSFVVHALPSLQLAVLFVKTQPLAGLHESLVHGLLSLHTVAAPPTQAPFEHESPLVHGLPSSQEPVFGVNVHPLAGLQPSFVHTLPSLQTGGAPPTH